MLRKIFPLDLKVLDTIFGWKSSNRIERKAVDYNFCMSRCKMAIVKNPVVIRRLVFRASDETQILDFFFSHIMLNLYGN